jgi:hypothetical protein
VAEIKIVDPFPGRRPWWLTPDLVQSRDQPPSVTRAQLVAAHGLICADNLKHAQTGGSIAQMAWEQGVSDAILALLAHGHEFDRPQNVAFVEQYLNKAAGDLTERVSWYLDRKLGEISRDGSN